VLEVGRVLGGSGKSCGVTTEGDVRCWSDSVVERLDLSVDRAADH